VKYTVVVWLQSAFFIGRRRDVERRVSAPATTHRLLLSPEYCFALTVISSSFDGQQLEQFAREIWSLIRPITRIGLGVAFGLYSVL